MKTLVILSALAISACNADSSAKPANDVALGDLARSLDAVRTEFNAHKHEARFLTLLAPT